VENAVLAEKALREFGFDVPELNAEMLIAPGKITRMGTPPLRIEILNFVSALTFDEAYANCRRMDLGGTIVPVMSLRDLIRNKRASGRGKDLLDAEELERGS